MSGIEETLAGNQAALGIQAEGEPVKTETAPVKPEEAKAEEPEVKEPTPEEAAKEARQKEIDEAVRKRLARAERKHEREMAELRAQINAKPPEPAPKLQGKPDPDKYESTTDYLEALTDWKVSQREQVREVKESKAREQTQFEETQKTWVQKLETTHKAHPDLEDLLEESGDLPTSPAMAQSVMESEVGGEILYHLAKHPDECKRIAGLSPLAAARAIGVIEARIQTTKPEPKKTTNAPPPPTPVKGSGGASPDLSKLSDDDWYKVRLQERRAR